MCVCMCVCEVGVMLLVCVGILVSLVHSLLGALRKIREDRVVQQISKKQGPIKIQSSGIPLNAFYLWLHVLQALSTSSIRSKAVS